jgi:hypothetical protein
MASGQLGDDFLEMKKKLKTLEKQNSKLKLENALDTVLLILNLDLSHSWYFFILFLRCKIYKK